MASGLDSDRQNSSASFVPANPGQQEVGHVPIPMQSEQVIRNLARRTLQENIIDVVAAIIHEAQADIREQLKRTSAASQVLLEGGAQIVRSVMERSSMEAENAALSEASLLYGSGQPSNYEKLESAIRDATRPVAQKFTASYFSGKSS